MKRQGTRNKFCEDERKENVTEKLVKETTFWDGEEHIIDKENDTKSQEGAQDIKRLQNTSNKRDYYSSTAPSTTTEHKSVGAKFQIVSEVVDNITVSEDQQATQEEDFKTTEVNDISSVASVTETIEIETSTDQQEIKELKGIKIENETSLLDSIMNQLLSFNVSSLETLREEETGKYTEVFSTEETILVTTDSFIGDATMSYEDLIIPQHLNLKKQQQ